MVVLRPEAPPSLSSFEQENGKKSRLCHQGSPLYTHWASIEGRNARLLQDTNSLSPEGARPIIPNRFSLASLSQNDTSPTLTRNSATSAGTAFMTLYPINGRSASPWASPLLRETLSKSVRTRMKESKLAWEL